MGITFAHPTFPLTHSSQFDDHADNPYPSKADKEELVARTGLSLKKIDYFAWNARKRNKDKYAVKTPKSRTAK